MKSERQKDMKIAMLAAMLAANAAPAIAAPVNLKCFLERSAGDGIFLFALDESMQQATVETPLGVYTKPAFFSPDTVRIEDKKDQSLLTSYIEISRTDLSIKSYLKVAGDNAPFIRKGTCKLYTPPKRAF
jgi:hypothetical protein